MLLFETSAKKKKTSLDRPVVAVAPCGRPSGWWAMSHWIALHSGIMGAKVEHDGAKRRVYTYMSEQHVVGRSMCCGNRRRRRRRRRLCLLAATKTLLLVLAIPLGPAQFTYTTSLHIYLFGRAHH